MDNPRAVSEVRPLFKKCRVEATVANPSRLRVESHLGSFGKVLAKRIRNRSVPSLNPRSKRLHCPKGKNAKKPVPPHLRALAEPEHEPRYTRPGKTSTIHHGRSVDLFFCCLRGSTSALRPKVIACEAPGVEIHPSPTSCDENPK